MEDPSLAHDIAAIVDKTIMDYSDGGVPPSDRYMPAWQTDNNRDALDRERQKHDARPPGGGNGGGKRDGEQGRPFVGLK